MVIAERDLQGPKHFFSLRKLLIRLHAVGTRRDRAGNRQQHMDQYGVLVLSWLFNPAICKLNVAVFEAIYRHLTGCAPIPLGEGFSEGLPMPREPA